MLPRAPEAAGRDRARASYPPLPSPSSSAPLPPNQVGWRTKSDVDAVVVTVDHPRHEAVVVGLADLRAVPVDLFVEYSEE